MNDLLAQSNKLQADLLARGRTREQAQVHVRTHQCLVALLAAVAVLYGPEARIDATNLLKPTIIITAQDRPVLLYTATLSGTTITRPGDQATSEIEQRLHDIRHKLAAELGDEPCQGDHAQAIRRALARLQRPEPTAEAQRLLSALTTETEHLKERPQRAHVSKWFRAALDHLQITAPFQLDFHEDGSAVIFPEALAYEAWRAQLRVIRHALTLPGAPALTLDLSKISGARIGDQANAELDRLCLAPTYREAFVKRAEKAILRGRSPGPVLQRARQVAAREWRAGLQDYVVRRSAAADPCDAEGGTTHG